MTRQNRVTPYGDVIVSPARGTLMGNRGCLHDEHGTIRRAYVGKRWIICLLEFKGRRRGLMTPGRYTELYFLDEVTGLAAGHRPCSECQRERFELFRLAWAKANPEIAAQARPSAAIIDAALQAERIAANGRKLLYEAELADLPNGAMVALKAGNDPYLVHGQRLLHWTAFGYDRALRRPHARRVEVLTPRSVVGALAAGYPVVVHPSAEQL